MSEVVQQRQPNREYEDKYYRLPSFYGKWLKIGICLQRTNLEVRADLCAKVCS